MMNSSWHDKIFTDQQAMLDCLHQLSQQQQIRLLDYQFARFISQNCNISAQLLLIVAYCSYHTSLGNVCLPLDKLGTSLTGNDKKANICQLNDLLAALDIKQIKQQLIQNSQLVSYFTKLEEQNYLSTSPTPLVLQQDNLYLQRYWYYEQFIYWQIQQRLTTATTAQTDSQLVQNSLEQLFTKEQGQQVNWQQLACAIAYYYNFCLISGGPGTGKTTTVTRLLSLLQIKANSIEQPLKIALCAPTGKAATRLTESISNSLQQNKQLFSQLGVLDSLQPTSSTIHRLLGASNNGFRYNQHHQLDIDVLVVDEVSMIGVELIYALLQAVPISCKVIFLGDKDQLPPVETGALLKQLCAQTPNYQFTEKLFNWLQQVCQHSLEPCSITQSNKELAQAVVMLQHSYRFNQHSGLGQLATAVNQQDDKKIAQIWQQGANDIAQLIFNKQQTDQLQQLVCGQQPQLTNGYKDYLTLLQHRPPTTDWQQLSLWASKVLQAMQSFQLLCCIHETEFGTLALNSKIESFLRQAGLLSDKVINKFYHGRPLMVSKNDYVLGLMNGDVGVTLAIPNATNNNVEEKLMVAFADAQAEYGVRWIATRLLTNAETVFAMTVHKAQGSEYKNVSLVLPQQGYPLLSKELYYTAITRAKQNFILFTPSLNSQIEQQIISNANQRDLGMEY